VRWVAKKASKVDGIYGLSDEAVDADPDDATFAEYDAEEKELALGAGLWRVTYWEDWIHSHNHTVKASSLRGAEVKEIKGEMKPVRIAKSPPA
jgi:hypothetical protein